MTTVEFSDQFDVFLDSYKIPDEFGKVENIATIKLDEYEKSVYLTKAQNELVKELYSGRTPITASYEQTEELRRYLSDLNKILIIDNLEPIEGVSDNAVKAIINDNRLAFITQEQCLVESLDPCIDGKVIDCIPIKRDEYNVIKNNPFKNKKIWRIDISANEVELVSKYTIKNYKVSYLVRPLPIILEDINPLSIDGVSTLSECELHPLLHEHILERAVHNCIRDLSVRFSSEKN